MTVFNNNSDFSQQQRKSLIQVALRYNAVFVNIQSKDIDFHSDISKDLAAFLMALSEKGYVVEEVLLRALNTVVGRNVSQKDLGENKSGGNGILEEITEVIDAALGINLNWAPLVKGWDVPTGESCLDHIITLYANLFGSTNMSGTTLPCGHFIPDGTFPLERYNGCPFCGTPFKTANFVYKGQGTKKRSLRLMTLSDLDALRQSLLTSSVPLDATQTENLKSLLQVFGVESDVTVAMKETRVVVTDFIVEKYLDFFREGNRKEGVDKEKIELLLTRAAKYLTSPSDILRLMWYRKTGKMQVLEPKTLILHAEKLSRHMWLSADHSADAKTVMKENLKLKYSRSECAMVAFWMNSLPMDAEQACEIMHPKRGMWVRMIRALRLGEYSRKPGYEKLAKLLDVFYKDDYSVWKREVDKALGNTCGCVDYDMALHLLQQRPGTFARSLFSVMLRMGQEKTLSSFRQVLDKVPSRLVLSLGNAAELYFDTKTTRIARPLTGSTKVIGHNRRLTNFTDAQRQQMTQSVLALYKDALTLKFKAEAGLVQMPQNEIFNSGNSDEDISKATPLKDKMRKIFIDKTLYDIPVSVGDRSSTIQDTSAALQGTRFKVEGDAVRLFMQWGKGLKARHLDMDLSAAICFKDGHKEDCAYFNLVATGAKHSGDIRSIPDKVGTAEYVELNLSELKTSGAKYVAFTSNAYSHGAISPNLMVGWMSSANPMKVSEKRGVAYDPSTVQHIVRISESNLAKGLVFGVLDVDNREITWLEMPFMGQFVGQLDTAAVEALLTRLKNKLSVGELLKIKAEAQNLAIVEKEDEADKDLRYTYTWALDASAVSKLL